MEAVQTKLKLTNRGKKNASPDKSWIIAMNALEKELDRLNALFSKAGFMLARKDFQSLSCLARNHSDLKMKMSKYFQRVKFYALEGRQRTAIMHTGIKNQLDDQLIDLTFRFYHFKDKLFSANKPNRGCL